MKKSTRSQGAASPSRLIDAWIEELNDWRGATLSRLRGLIQKADPERSEHARVLRRGDAEPDYDRDARQLADCHELRRESSPRLIMNARDTGRRRRQLDVGDLAGVRVNEVRLLPRVVDEQLLAASAHLPHRQPVLLQPLTVNLAELRVPVAVRVLQRYSRCSSSSVTPVLLRSL